jgi:hypothetical protein
LADEYLAGEASDRATSMQLGRYGPVAVATVTMALATWPIAFNLGAYDAVFYEDIFRFVVAATVGLAIAVVKPPYTGRRLWFTRVALATPAVWLALAVLLFDSTATAASDPVFGTLALLVAIVSIPTVLKLLMDLFVPGLTGVGDARTLGFAVAVIAVIAMSTPSRPARAESCCLPGVCPPVRPPGGGRYRPVARSLLDGMLDGSPPLRTTRRHHSRPGAR